MRCRISRLAGFFAGLLLVCLFPSELQAVDYTVKTIPNVRLSDASDYVSNPDGILTVEDVSAINALLKMLEDSLGVEVAVVAVESIGNNDARAFATELFEHWGIGKKGDDNGLLIQLVTEPVQRSVVFETGYGLEGVLPDAICYRLQQQYMLPDMKEGNYSLGMYKGVEAVKEYLFASDYERTEMVGGSSEEGSSMNDIIIMLLMFLFFPFVIISMVVIGYIRKYRKRVCPRCGQKALVYARRNIIRQATYSSSGLAQNIYQCKNCGYTEQKEQVLSRLSRSSGSFSGGGRSGGNGGGGSWGGGRSGGGGSISRF